MPFLFAYFDCSVNISKFAEFLSGQDGGKEPEGGDSAWQFLGHGDATESGFGAGGTSNGEFGVSTGLSAHCNLGIGAQRLIPLRELGCVRDRERLTARARERERERSSNL
jgi:hypothetical protein